jgi:hypothetical protein
MIDKGDIVQLDPASELGKAWGPQFVVVDELKTWGFQGYFIHAEKRGDFSRAYLRVPSGTFERVGRAVWMIDKEADHG